MDSRPWIRAAALDTAEALLAHARAVPQDKLKWQPLDTGRSVLNQMAECASAFIFFRRTLMEGSGKWVTPEIFAEARAQWDQYNSVAEIEEDMTANINDFYDFAAGLPDESMDVVIDMMPGWSLPIKEALFMPLQNMIYHLGQISQIQVMLGDQGMHRLPGANSEPFHGLDPRPFLAATARAGAPRVVSNFDSMPEDKRDWTPAEGMRSARQQLAEVVQAYGWSEHILTKRTIEGIAMDPESGAAAAEAIYAKGLEASLTEAIDSWEKAMMAVPAEDLDEKVELFAPGWFESLQSNAWYPVWNQIYHTGAVAYFQTLYGDGEMH
jgi:hypothetical protein